MEQVARLVDALAVGDFSEEPSPEWRAAFAALTREKSERACMAVARYWLRRADPVEALAAVMPALENPEPSQRLLGWVITLARRLIDKRLCAVSIMALAKTTDAVLGTALLVQAAEMYKELGDR